MDLYPMIEDSNLRPPPDVVDEVEEYEVKRIQWHEGGKRWWRHLVKWRGYPDSEAT
jgi:hypothetical protein